MKKIALFLFPFLLVSLFAFNLNAPQAAAQNEEAASAERVGLLPGNPFYFLKEWRRGLSRLFTRDPIAKTELEIKIIDERGAEIERLEEKNASQRALERALANFEKSRMRLAETLMNLPSIEVNPRVSEVIDEIAKRTVRQVEMITAIRERLKERVADESSVKVQFGEFDFYEEEKSKDTGYATPCGPEPQLAAPPAFCNWQIRCLENEKRWDAKLICDEPEESPTDSE
jgi:hypothetical protein